MPGTLAPLQRVDDPKTQQNFDQIFLNWPVATFLLSAPNVRARIVAGGFVGATGATLVAGTADWTVVRNALGNYTVTFTTAFSSANVVGIPVIYQGANVTDTTVLNATTFTILTFNLAGGAADPTGVLFLAWGTM